MSSDEPIPDYSSKASDRGRSHRWKGPVRLLVILLIASLLVVAIWNTTYEAREPSTIHIQNVGTFQIDPVGIEAKRTDVFKAGHFSVFDVLVHLDEQRKIEMEYHWDASLGTHVIDSINGKVNWWYKAYYEGGWLEENNFRMDLYPYKDKMTIQVTRISSGYIDIVHDSFREEMLRLEDNSGAVIIPTVTITGPGLAHTFKDVAVTPHNLRIDTFKPGTITAIDVIMSLGDQDKIDYKMQWYEEIAGSDVKTYFITSIDGHAAYDRCGFVYEEGDENDQFGNHIHIPSDIRVITSPEYEKWFWICI